MAEIGQDINKAKQALMNGDLVGIPTETVYGLAGNALNEDAVLKIFATKNRPSFDPLIIHSNSIEKLERWVKPIPTSLKHIAQHFWPGPLTILVPKQAMVPDLVTSGLENVAIRIPNHTLTLSLLEELDFPLAAPSANPFGYISPTTAMHVNDQLGNQIPYILDGGACNVGVESTIIQWIGNDIEVLRLGGLSIEQLEDYTQQKIKLHLNQSSNPAAPGMLKSHYAPRKPLYIGNIEELMQQNKHLKVGVLSFQKTYPEAAVCYPLSKDGSDMEASKNLFHYMRRLDQANIDIILTEYIPYSGLGRAVNDRLKRASVQH
jgi:L-threonylcarbamoyladenylate synthase